MPPALPGPDGQTLAADYEALRPAAVTPGMPAPPRGGMVAWMRSVGDGAGRAAIPRPTRSPTALPADVHQPVIDILATMVFASAREHLT